MEQLQAKVSFFLIQSIKMSQFEAKIETPAVEEQIKRPEYLNKTIKSENQEGNQEINDLNYNNASKGNYEPPALFLDGCNDEDCDVEQNNDDVLESVRQKLER